MIFSGLSRTEESGNHGHRTSCTIPDDFARHSRCHAALMRAHENTSTDANVNSGNFTANTQKLYSVKAQPRTAAAAENTVSQRAASPPSRHQRLLPRSTRSWLSRPTSETCGGRSFACCPAAVQKTTGRHRQLKPSTELSHVATNAMKKSSCQKRTRIFSQHRLRGSLINRLMGNLLTGIYYDNALSY